MVAQSQHDESGAASVAGALEQDSFERNLGQTNFCITIYKFNYDPSFPKKVPGMCVA